MDALGLPKGSDAEKAARKEAIQAATLYATEVPAQVMQLCYDSMEVAEAMAEIGNPNSVTDAAVGALAARAGVRGAFLNVRINAAGLEDKGRVAKFIAEGEKLCKLAEEREAKILAIADTKINK